MIYKQRMLMWKIIQKLKHGTRIESGADGQNSRPKHKITKIQSKKQY